MTREGEYGHQTSVFQNSENHGHALTNRDGWDQNGLRGPRAPGFLGYPGVLQHQQDKALLKRGVSNKHNIPVLL